MGIAQVRLRGFQLGQQAPGGVELAQVAAQDSVNEPRLQVEAALPGQLDGFVNGGVVGDAIEPKDLVKAEPQEVLQDWLLGARVGFAGDQPIKGGLPADDAIGQLLTQVAVGDRKVCSGQFRFEPVFHEIPARAPLEDAHCNFSWFFVAHDL